MRADLVAVSAVVIAIGAAGCSQQGSTHDENHTPTVVASTDVWGSVASAVAGEYASVKSIESGASADPHSFEATPADVAEIEIHAGGT